MLKLVPDWRLGTVRVTGPTTNRVYLIPRTGLEVDEDDFYLLIEMEFDIWCPAESRLIKRQGLFPAKEF